MPADQGAVILATCQHRRDVTESDGLLVAALGDLGISVRSAPWDEISPATLGGSLVCIRSTWDYHHRSDEFRAWAAHLRQAGVTVVNPVETIHWNMDKGYLGELEAAGIAIPPTRWIEADGEGQLPAILSDAGWERAVLKPRISATAHGTHLISRGEVLNGAHVAALHPGGALLQAFVPEIQVGGELSLMFIDGEFSHAVRKQPATADFRVQAEFGGTVGPASAPAALVTFGARVLHAAPVPWTYARVDMVDTAGGPLLMELELIEPDLFLGFSPAAAQRLAGAVARLVRAGRTGTPHD